jgi:hypothetical protein
VKGEKGFFSGLSEMYEVNALKMGMEPKQGSVDGFVVNFSNQFPLTPNFFSSIFSSSLSKF